MPISPLVERPQTKKEPTRYQKFLTFDASFKTLIATFAAALMERFTVRKVVMAALATVGTGALLTIWMSQSWHLMLLWGVVVGVGTGSMALVFAATIANRWFVKKRGLVIGILTAAAASGQLVFLPGLSKLAQDPGWRASSLVIALGAYLMVPLIYLFLKEDPQSIGITPYGAADDWAGNTLV